MSPVLPYETRNVKVGDDVGSAEKAATAVMLGSAIPNILRLFIVELVAVKCTNETMKGALCVF